jgi:hypothetical protein
VESEGKMSKIFLQYNDTLYSFDLLRLKLYRIVNNEFFEITDAGTIKLVRLKAMEISSAQAVKLTNLPVGP